jgi:SAM-dependent methyltransferase
MSENAGNPEGGELIQGSYARQGQRWRDDKYRSWMPGNLLNNFERKRAWLEMLRRRNMLPLTGKRILDVGCGEGKLLLGFLNYGASIADLVGIDVIPSNIEGGTRIAPMLDLRILDASRMDFADDSFDIVTTSMAFSSMPTDEMRGAAAAEMLRVVKPDGAILWYDFFVNPRNREVTPVTREMLGVLFPGCAIDARKVTLAPPIARVVAPRSWVLAEMLGALPFLRTHWAALIAPGGRSGSGTRLTSHRD